MFCQYFNQGNNQRKNMNQPPLLTIFLLAFNSENSLEKTLNSLLSQSYPNFELIISDNGSTDQTIEIIKSFQKTNPQIIFRKNTPKIIPGAIYDGCYDNSNGCLRSGLIKGEFTAICHAGDVYEKEFAQKEAELLIKNPQVGAVFSLGKKLDDQEKIVGKLKLPKQLKEKNVYNFEEIFRALLINGNVFLPTPTFMARTKIFEEVGFFDETIFGPSRDLDMWLRILEKYSIGIINQELIKYQVGGRGKEKKPTSLLTEKADFFNVMDYYLDSKNLKQKSEKKHLRQYEYQKRFNDTFRAMNFLIKGEDEKAKELIKKPLSFSLFLAFFENISLKKIKGAVLRLLMKMAIPLGLAKPLGWILLRLR